MRSYNYEVRVGEVGGVLRSLLQNHENFDGVRLLVRPSAIISCVPMC